MSCTVRCDLLGVFLWSVFVSCFSVWGWVFSNVLRLVLWSSRPLSWCGFSIHFWFSFNSSVSYIIFPTDVWGIDLLRVTKVTPLGWSTGKLLLLITCTSSFKKKSNKHTRLRVWLAEVFGWIHAELPQGVSVCPCVFLEGSVRRTILAGLLGSEAVLG